MRWLQLREPPGGGDITVAVGLQEQWLTAVEAQVDAMHAEFSAMRDQIIDLQDRLANTPQQAVTTAVDQVGAQPGETSGFFGPGYGTP